MPTFTKEKIVNTCTNIIEATGVSHQNAKLIAELLAEANSTGHDSHGIIRIPQYLAAIENNDILTNSDIDIVRENPLTAIVDGKALCASGGNARNISINRVLSLARGCKEVFQRTDCLLTEC